MSQIRNIAHDLLAVVGVLLAMQAPITAYLGGFGVQGKVIDLGFGGLGMLVTLVSKYIDSQNHAAITTAWLATTPLANRPAQPPTAP